MVPYLCTNDTNRWIVGLSKCSKRGRQGSVRRFEEQPLRRHLAHLPFGDKMMRSADFRSPDWDWTVDSGRPMDGLRHSILPCYYASTHLYALERFWTGHALGLAPCTGPARSLLADCLSGFGTSWGSNSASAEMVNVSSKLEAKLSSPDSPMLLLATAFIAS
jgi:hypothetical protein